MSSERVVIRQARFDPDRVSHLLEVAEATGHTVDLAKDTGAYLVTWPADGSTPTADLIVYADGHTPPPPSDPATIGPDDPWILARLATEAVFGGDDFAESFTPAELRSALTPRGLFVRTTLRALDLPAEYPTGPWGRRDPLHQLEALELVAGPEAPAAH